MLKKLLIISLFSTSSFCMENPRGSLDLPMYRHLRRPLIHANKTDTQHIDSNLKQIKFKSFECSICLDTVDQAKFVKVLKCHDRFHRNCINAWLNREVDEFVDKYICPHCKQKVDQPNPATPIDDDGNEITVEGGILSLPKEIILEIIKNLFSTAGSTKELGLAIKIACVNKFFNNLLKADLLPIKYVAPKVPFCKMLENCLFGIPNKSWSERSKEVEGLLAESNSIALKQQVENSIPIKNVWLSAFNALEAIEHEIFSARKKKWNIKANLDKKNSILFLNLLSRMKNLSKEAQNLFIDAVNNGNINHLIMALNNGATFLSRTSKGLTPLMCAVKNGHKDIVDLLLKLRVNVNECLKTSSRTSEYHCESSRAFDAGLQVMETFETALDFAKTDDIKQLLKNYGATRGFTSSYVKQREYESFY